MPFDIEVTEDGSFSCRDSATGQLYHNEAGAAAESFKNYAAPSLRFDSLCSQKKIAILDSCFGLGYNTFALLESLLKKYSEEKNGNGAALNHSIHVHAVELDQAVIRFLPQVLEQPYFPLLNEAISQASFDTAALRTFGFHKLASGKIKITIELIQSDLRTHLAELSELAEKKATSGSTTEDKKFDFVYHDPFSPQKVVELWTLDLFQKYFALMADQSCLLTYSAASAIRGALKQCGFELFRTASLGVKKGGTAALKGGLDPQIDTDDQEDEPDEHAILSNLSYAERARMEGRTGVPYRDPSFKGDSKEIFRRREEEQNTDFPL